MIESLTTVLILHVLVIASLILDSHLLGDLRVVFSWNHFAFSFCLFCILHYEELHYGLSCHSDKPSSSFVANKNECYQVQALCDTLYVHYLFNTPSKAHTVIFSLLEIEKPQVIRMHRFIGEVLVLGFSDQ